MDSGALVSRCERAHGLASDILIGPSGRLQRMSELVLPSDRLVTCSVPKK